MVAVAMFILLILFSRLEIILRTECSICGRRYATRHDMAAVPSDPSTLHPVYRMWAVKPSTCLCDDPLSGLILTEVSLGDPQAEVQVNLPD